MPLGVQSRARCAFNYGVEVPSQAVHGITNGNGTQRGSHVCRGRKLCDGLVHGVVIFSLLEREATSAENLQPARLPAR